jgi:hypothetical protein
MATWSPEQVVIGALVFALGLLAGAGIAATLQYSPDSINKGRFLVDRSGGAVLVNVCSVGVNRQRHHGSTGGEQEDERHCCDEGLHGWTPLVTRMASEHRHPRRPRRNQA